VICSEPAKSQTNGHPVVQYSKQSNGVSHQNGHLITAPHREDFSVPEFNLIETDVRGYRRLVDEVRTILTDRQSRLESLIERQQLPDEVDGDVRLARGKIIVIVKNNLSTFDRLLKVTLQNLIISFTCL
jgi:hypothetical protein